MQHRGAAAAAQGALAAVQELVDLGEAGVDPDHLGAALVQEVVAPGAAAVHLDREAAEVAEPLVADTQEGPPLPPQQARVGTPGRDGRRGSLVRAAAEERHLARV